MGELYSFQHQPDVPESQKMLNEAIGNPGSFSGSSSVTIRGDEVTIEEHRVHSSEDAPKNLQGVLETAKVNGHGVINGQSDLTNETLVTVQGGLEMTVRQALDAGLLNRDPRGDITDPNAPAPETTEETPEPSVQPLADEAETQNEEMYQTLGKDGTDALVARVLASDNLAEMNVQDVADVTGKSVEEVRESINTQYTAFADQVSVKCDANGIEYSEFVDWARENVPRAEIQRVALEQYHSGTTKGWDSMMLQFMKAKGTQA